MHVLSVLDASGGANAPTAVAIQDDLLKVERAVGQLASAGAFEGHGRASVADIGLHVNTVQQLVDAGVLRTFVDQAFVLQVSLQPRAVEW